MLGPRAQTPPAWQSERKSTKHSADPSGLTDRCFPTLFTPLHRTLPCSFSPTFERDRIPPHRQPLDGPHTASGGFLTPIGLPSFPSSVSETLPFRRVPGVGFGVFFRSPAISTCPSRGSLTWHEHVPKGLRAPPDAPRYLASGKRADYGGEISPFQKVGRNVWQGSDASPNRRSLPPSYRQGHAAQSPSPAPGAGAPALFGSSIDMGVRPVGE